MRGHWTLVLGLRLRSLSCPPAPKVVDELIKGSCLPDASRHPVECGLEGALLPLPGSVPADALPSWQGEVRRRFSRFGNSSSHAEGVVDGWKGMAGRGDPHSACAPARCSALNRLGLPLGSRGYCLNVVACTWRGRDRIRLARLRESDASESRATDKAPYLPSTPVLGRCHSSCSLLGGLVDPLGHAASEQVFCLPSRGRAEPPAFLLRLVRSNTWP